MAHHLPKEPLAENQNFNTWASMHTYPNRSQSPVRLNKIKHLDKVHSKYFMYVLFIVFISPAVPCGSRLRPQELPLGTLHMDRMRCWETDPAQQQNWTVSSTVKDWVGTEGRANIAGNKPDSHAEEKVKLPKLGRSPVIFQNVAVIGIRIASQNCITKQTTRGEILTEGSSSGMPRRILVINLPW